MKTTCKKCGKKTEKLDGCCDGENVNYLCDKCSDWCISRKRNSCFLGCYDDNTDCWVRGNWDGRDKRR